MAWKGTTMLMRPLHYLLVPYLIAVFSVSTLAQDWLQFRGPGGLGVSEAENLPLTWSETENVAWKTAPPGYGGEVKYSQRIRMQPYGSALLADRSTFNASPIVCDGALILRSDKNLYAIRKID